MVRDLWENRRIPEDERSSFRYVIELGEKLTECAQLAAKHADVSIARSYFDLRSQNHQFQPGDEVLLLLLSDSSKLLVAWSGPHKVSGKWDKVDHRLHHT